MKKGMAIGEPQLPSALVHMPELSSIVSASPRPAVARERLEERHEGGAHRLKVALLRDAVKVVLLARGGASRGR